MPSPLRFSLRGRSANWLAVALLGACVAAGTIVAAARPVAAQQPAYEQLDVYAKMEGESREAKNMRNNVVREVRSILRGTTPLAQKQKLFDAWFNLYYFPVMTKVANVGQLAELRRELFEDYIEDARSDEAHDHLVLNVTYPMMTKLVEGNYHPAVRYNAMLVLAMLNAREARTVGDRTPPEPLPQALPYMLNALQQEGLSDALRVAALYGVLRHVELDRKFPAYQPIPANLKQQIASVMESIASAEVPPDGVERSPEGHAWIRRRAIEVLAALGTVGNNNQYVALLDQTVKNDQAPASLRCTAARGLGRFNYANASGINALALAEDLGNLAADVCRQELDRIQAERELRESKKALQRSGGAFPDMGPGGMPGMPGMPGGDAPPGMMPGMPGEPGGAMPGGMPGFGAGGPGLFGDAGDMSPEEQRSVLRTRRLLKYQFFCVQQGLGSEENQTGVGATVGDPQKAEFKKIREALVKLMDVTNLEDMDQESLSKELRAKVGDLEALVVRQEDIPAADAPVGPGADVPGGGPAADVPGGGPAADVPGGRAAAARGPDLPN